MSIPVAIIGAVITLIALILGGVETYTIQTAVNPDKYAEISRFSWAAVADNVGSPMQLMGITLMVGGVILHLVRKKES